MAPSMAPTAAPTEKAKPVPFYAIFILLVFWCFCFALMAALFAKLRAGYKAKYEALLEEGAVTIDNEAELATDDMAHDETHVHAEEEDLPKAPGALAFLSFPDDETSSQVRERQLGGRGR